MQQRSTTIDAVRGICLVNIFVNHIENGYLTNLSPSGLGFSDSADIFVLLSGISVALAARQTEARCFGEIVVHLWRRAAYIYGFEVLLVLATLGLLSAIFALRGVEGIHAPETRLLRDYGLRDLLWHALTMRQTVGYSSVLRLYVALMLLAPFLLRLAAWRFWAPLPLGLLIWIPAGHFAWVIPNSLTGAPFALTILPWTLLFAIGIVVGQGMIRGIVLPHSRLITCVAFAFLATYLIIVVVLGNIWPAVHQWVTTRNDHFWLGASKTYQSPLRVLHVLALAYLVMALPNAPLIRLLHQMPRNHLLARLGCRSLPVFTGGALGSVIASEGLDLAAIPLSGAWLPMLLLEASAIALFVALALQRDGHRGRILQWFAILRPRRDRCRTESACREEPSAPIRPQFVLG
ncbi:MULTISPECIES: OpgC domain-containing protein [unclassified Methylobacterium]|uniref:OpgC domain-containing protein n=1 Tax=unclassified Methylobacterium TaxID=2615210 RepID=UPI0009EAF1B8|nr:MULTISPECIES: OpgC domain-containing protein [unclassified Methylobacterium]MCK2054582.1 OpgC domain-containing protein [Methylobacterium sp. 37f]